MPEILSMTEDGSGRVFAASHASGVCRTTDGGLSWQSVGTGFVNNYNNDPTILADRNGYIYMVGYDNPMLRSTDQGETWSAFANGIPMPVTSMGIARDSSGYLWIGLSDHGIWHSTLATASTYQNDGHADRFPGDIRLIPNPLEGAGKFSFALRSSGEIQLKVYDLLGRVVATIIDRRFEEGRYEIPWSVAGLAPGTYYYALVVDDCEMARKFVVSR
jgi:hypothetical protein